MLGITFGYKHSYDDWGLILTDRSIGFPEPNRFTVKVPGADGLLDVTEALTPNITYQNRKVSFEFKTKGGPTEWDELIRDISGYLHGQKLKVWEDVDEDWYWDGFWTVDSFKSSRSLGTIVIKGDVHPYKFKDGVTEVTETISGETEITLENSRMPAIPEIETDAEITIEFGEYSATLAAGTYMLPDIVLQEGDNLLTITGNAEVTITYQEGAL